MRTNQQLEIKTYGKKTSKTDKDILQNLNPQGEICKIEISYIQKLSIKILNESSSSSENSSANLTPMKFKITPIISLRKVKMKKAKKQMGLNKSTKKYNLDIGSMILNR